MFDSKFAEDRARREVDRLFRADAHRKGQGCQWPVMGGGYMRGLDRTKKMRDMAVRALVARDWFAVYGPSDAPPLPPSYTEREALKGGPGLLPYMVALFARSLESRKYDFEEHPAFADYVSGALWEVEVLGIGRIPNYNGELDPLKKRFPPRLLRWLGPGLYWLPPKEQAAMMAKYPSSYADWRIAHATKHIYSEDKHVLFCN